jgi:hypothetical protein
MILGARMEMNDCDAANKNMEWQWVNSKDEYPAAPTGNAVEVATALYKKYGK